MILRSLSHLTTLAAIVVFAGVSHAASVPLSKSSGLSVTISKVLISGNKVILQFVATNNTDGRVYIRDAAAEESQKGFLGSGAQLSRPSIVGIEQCPNDVTSCIRPDSGYNGNDLNQYSYIEPHEFTSFGYTYDAPSPVQDNDSISFSAAFIARFASPNGDPSQAGSMKAVRFNFPYVMLKAH